MKMSDIRARSSEELKELLCSMKSELFTLKLRMPTSGTEGKSISRKFIRRDVARILTCLKESKRG